MAKSSSGATHVVRRPGARSVFTRSVRDDDGNVVDTLEFTPEQPLELTPEQLSAVQEDLGIALAIVEPDTDRPGRYDVNWEETHRVRREAGAKEVDAPEPKRKHVGTGKRASKPEPVSEAEAIRQQLAETPNVSNKEVIDALAAKGVEVNSSQVSRERK